MSSPGVDAVLSSLPADAEQQLEVGLHVLRHAFRKKVRSPEIPGMPTLRTATSCCVGHACSGSTSSSAPDGDPNHFPPQVKELETDNANMRQFGKEKQNQVVMLEQKVASLETVVDDMTRRAKDLAAENARVASERDALAENVKKLTRDLKRLGNNPSPPTAPPPCCVAPSHGA